jgi:hypothetical protein
MQSFITIFFVVVTLRIPAFIKAGISYGKHYKVLDIFYILFTDHTQTHEKKYLYPPYGGIAICVQYAGL